ncbi:MAG TPA: porin family protein [bacterium]|nr:porin family protein [bacterium]
MKKTGMMILYLCLLTSGSLAGEVRTRRFHAGLSAGFGLPRIPWGTFHTPLSVTTDAFVSMRIGDGWALGVDAGGLHTFNINAVTANKDKLRFNLIWVSSNALFRINRSLLVESFILAGAGVYRLDQALNEEGDTLNTPGINLGIVGWRYYRRWGTVLEIRWHFLFRPSSNPQVLTVSAGFLF